MVMNGHLGFKVKLSDIRNGIFLPKYYDPDIQQRLNELSLTHRLVPFADLVSEKLISMKTGHEIGKLAYGTGSIPFVRTSDISNWEVKADPKQGVSEEVFAQFADRQDTREGDIFFVRDGTYLVGQSCMVTRHDLPCLFQSHIIKIRVSPKSIISKELLFASLNSPIVKKQIRSRQFTSDIIDTVGNRLLEVVLPVPKDDKARLQIETEVRTLVDGRLAMREKIRQIPLIAQGIIESYHDDVPDQYVDEVVSNPGFLTPSSQIFSNIYIPKYYDPTIKEELDNLSRTHELVLMGDLLDRKVIRANTGIEIGKMSYGTGDIPFVRTSDISNWELKSDPKQNISEEIYQRVRQDIKAEDILLVRDGTYLVGTSCILTEKDTRMLYCGGLYKIRVLRQDIIDPYLLLALLNTPVVRRQIRSKKFTRDIIDTLGKRLSEIVIPIPKAHELKRWVAEETRSVIAERVRLREQSKSVGFKVESLLEPEEEEATL